jgi:hypothetical protein
MIVTMTAARGTAQGTKNKSAIVSARRKGSANVKGIAPVNRIFLLTENETDTTTAGTLIAIAITTRKTTARGRVVIPSPSLACLKQPQVAWQELPLLSA